jgi:tetratricopeptide (TPR) repeat protein/predicted Ser/Thr protein kinase
MNAIKGLWSAYWDSLLGVPIGWLESWFGLDMDSTFRVLTCKLGCTVIIICILWEVYTRFRDFRRTRKYKNDYKEGIKQVEGTLVKDTEFVESLEAVQAPKQTIEALKKAKQWGRLGKVYASLNRNKEAAKAFRKAGDPKSAAMELAKIGQTVKAGKLLQKAGDHATAARFFEEKEKYVLAARAYEQLEDLAQAATCYAKGNKYDLAVTNFRAYFATSIDGPEAQGKIAESCFHLLEDEVAQGKITEEDQNQLREAVAERFEASQRYDLAAKLFLEIGDRVRAGQIYVRAGRLEEAAKCMQEAGRGQEASEIGGRYLETQKRWREAAQAYEKAGNFRRAGDCWTKAPEAANAAKCYEKAGEFYGAGFALLHSGKWEGAILMLQKIKEDNPRFAESRALLGRCFYELHDYAHCAAALDNHLTGDRVDTGNIDYFNMLALAYEQLGDLEKSKEILLKIQSVNVGFRDVSQRLSNIESRISLAPGAESAMRPASTPDASQSDQATAVMQMVNTQVGQRYTLERELGRGGMGVVYKAIDTQLDRPVALKFLGSLVDGSDEFRQRFVREAQAAAQVSHPNILSVYEISTQPSNFFIAMEYVEGPNIGQYLQRKGKLTVREAVNLMSQACAALGAIHEKGIVHRDIKPDNLLIAKGGLVKLMDFGLAKGHGARLTGTNVVMGTPCYMSPEQVRGEDVTAASDIYAIGMMLHELLTGKAVFADGNVLARQLDEIPKPPSEFVEDVPELLDQIVMKCIAKSVKDRFATTADLLKYLRQVGK